MATKKNIKKMKATIPTMMPVECRLTRDKEELRMLIEQQISKGNELLGRYPEEIRDMLGRVIITREIEQRFIKEYNTWEEGCENIYKHSFDFEETPYLRQFREDDIPLNGVFRNEVGVLYTEYRLTLLRQIGELKSFLQQIDSL